tara:strand:- start:825 stop:1010 length:186 start_codon:yes stop_codon:yes gene_type:complete
LVVVEAVEFMLHQERTELVVQVVVEPVLMEQVVVQPEQQTLVVEVEVQDKVVLEVLVLQES